MKVLLTVAFTLISATCAGVAAGSWLAGLSVFFGIWAIAGAVETIMERP
jgi:hypothetical protein